MPKAPSGVAEPFFIAQCNDFARLFSGPAPLASPARSLSQDRSPWNEFPWRATGHNPSAPAVTTDALQSEGAAYSSGGSCSANA